MCHKGRGRGDDDTGADIRSIVCLVWSSFNYVCVYGSQRSNSHKACWIYGLEKLVRGGEVGSVRLVVGASLVDG